jgi:WhiB family redox-sensing transcriptional regulator
MVEPSGSIRLSSRDNMSWMEHGACQNRDDDAKIFFPEPGNNASQAKRMCTKCPVRLKCLEWSLVTRQMYGVWGGVAEKKRRQMMQLRYGRTPYYAIMEEDDGQDVSTSPAIGGTR